MRLRRGRLRRYVTVQKGPLLRPPGAKTRLSLWLVHYGRKVAAVNASAKGVSQRKLAADPGFSSAATCPYLASQVEAQHLDGRADVALGVLFAGVVLGVFSPLTVLQPWSLVADQALRALGGLHGGDGEPRENAQPGLHHHPRVVHPPLKRRRGKLCCLSARPHDLADLTAARPEVACVPPSYVSCLYSKRAALTRALVFVFHERTFCRRFEQTSRGTTRMHVSHARPWRAASISRHMYDGPLWTPNGRYY